MVEGNSAADLRRWLDTQRRSWLEGIGVVATDLAESYRAADEVAEIRSLDKTLASWRTEILAPPQHRRVERPHRGHPDTLTSRHNVACWTGEAGDPGAAARMFAELVPVFERVLGAEHPDTLGARNILAKWRGRPPPPGSR
jgi:hypothetical protein